MQSRINRRHVLTGAGAVPALAAGDDAELRRLFDAWCSAWREAKRIHRVELDADNAAMASVEHGGGFDRALKAALDEAEAATSAAWDVCNEAMAEIAATPAEGMAGVAIKIAVLDADADEVGFGDLSYAIVNSVADDIEAMGLNGFRVAAMSAVKSKGVLS